MIDKMMDAIKKQSQGTPTLVYTINNKIACLYRCVEKNKLMMNLYLFLETKIVARCVCIFGRNKFQNDNCRLHLFVPFNFWWKQRKVAMYFPAEQISERIIVGCTSLYRRTLAKILIFRIEWTKIKNFKRVKYSKKLADWCK